MRPKEEDQESLGEGVPEAGSRRQLGASAGRGAAPGPPALPGATLCQQRPK